MKWHAIVSGLVERRLFTTAQLAQFECATSSEMTYTDPAKTQHRHRSKHERHNNSVFYSRTTLHKFVSDILQYIRAVSLRALNPRHRLIQKNVASTGIINIAFNTMRLGQSARCYDGYDHPIALFTLTRLKRFMRSRYLC